MKRRLLFVVNVDWFFLSHRLPIARRAVAEGYEVHLATAFTGKQEELRKHGLTLHPLSLERRGAGLLNALRVMRELWKVYRAVDPDVVHLVTIKPVLLGGVVARLARVRNLVVAVSGLGHVFIASGVFAAIRRAFVKTAYRKICEPGNVKVIFQNADDFRETGLAGRLRPEQAVMIRGSGVDLSQYSPTAMPSGPVVVTLASRLLAEKGVREFAEAARLLRQAGVDARFCLVGQTDPGNPASLDESTVNAWVTEGVVEWWGHRADMPAVLAASHVVVLPSYREGFPRVLIEAAACARPVVTTDVPGCRDAIEPGVTGLLVPARDVTELANAMRSLISDSVRRETMGRAGRERAERLFDVDAVVRSHLEIYRELIERP